MLLLVPEDLVNSDERLTATPKERARSPVCELLERLAAEPHGASAARRDLGTLSRERGAERASAFARNVVGWPTVAARENE